MLVKMYAKCIPKCKEELALNLGIMNKFSYSTKKKKNKGISNGIEELELEMKRRLSHMSDWRKEILDLKYVLLLFSH